MLRSRFTRLAFVMTLVPTITILILGAFSYQRMYAQLSIAYDLRLNDEIAALTLIYSQGGKTALVDAINQREAMYPSERDRISYRLFVDQVDLINAAPFVDATTGFVEYEKLRGRVTPLGENVLLGISTNTFTRQKALLSLFQDTALAVFICIIISGLFGILAARNFAQRFREVNNVIDKVSNGDIDARLTKDEAGDEISFMSRRINMMLDRIQHLLKVRKRISDQVAHEVRTPLSQLASAIDNLNTQTATENEKITSAKHNLHHCVNLLDGLLDISSLEAQIGDKQGFSQVSLAIIVKRISEFYDALAEDKGLTLTQSVENDAIIFADTPQIERLVANLLDNAIKYTAEGGTVSIELKPHQNAVSLIIEDTGVGIDVSNTSALFDPFYRHSNAVVAKGHGLGLSLVKAIADRHDASIRVDNNTSEDTNNAGVGSRFEVVFTTLRG